MLARLLGTGRSRRVISNVMGGLVARAGALILLFYSTRLMLDLLGAEQLGVWLVVLGLLQWVTFFDLGIAYGARNEIARCIAAGDIQGAARTVATAYFYCLLVAGGIGILVLLMTLLPLGDVLRRHVFAGKDAAGIIGICMAAFLVNFVLGFVQQIYAALEKAAALSVYTLLVNAVFVVALLCLWHGAPVMIIQVAIAYCVAMLLPNLLLSWWLFSRHPELRPSLALVDGSLRPRIFSIGVPLFVVQLSALVIFSTDRVLVSAVVGPAAVVVYDAAFKVFSVITMAHGLMMGVLWSSFTHAYITRDWDWIGGVLRRLQYLMLPLALACVAMALLAPRLITGWLGAGAVGTGSLYAGFAVFSILSCWSNIYAYFLNGIGNVRVQMYSAACAALINIPLSIFFARVLGMGEAGVIWGTVVSLCFFSVIGPWQTARVFRNEAYK